jgi:hypothetical protein
MPENITAEEAYAAVLAGQTVKLVVGPDPEDPTLLHYLDRCWENYGQPMIYQESIGGWSQGVKEAICEADSTFYVEYATKPEPLSLTITDEEPPMRESVLS